MTKRTFEKYKMVIDEWFINGFNGAQAYLKYYPKVKPDTAKVKFSNIVTIGNVATYVKSKHERIAEKSRSKHETLLKELENWAYSDITETMLLTPEQIKELPPEIKRLISKFKSTTRTYGTDEHPVTETVVELWFVSKERAMEMIHKHVGFYEKDNEQRSNLVTETREERDKRIDELLKLRKNADR